MTQFPALVLTCSNGHSEVTTGVAIGTGVYQGLYGADTYCGRCGDELYVSRRITVVLGRRHSEMGCHALVETPQ